MIKQIVFLCCFAASCLNGYVSNYDRLKELGMIQSLTLSDFQKKWIDTTVGRIAYFETSGIGDPIMLIHGNSCSKEFMIKQLDGLGAQYKMIALDLPGHGESDNALHPAENYTLAGYANVVAEVIQKLELEPVILVGWSLGGDVVLEVMATSPELLKGAVISGTPPVVRGPDGISAQGIQEGYLPFDLAYLVMKKEQFSQEDVKAYWSSESVDLDKYPILAEACQRTDGQARHTACQAILRGEGTNEQELVKTSLVPLGIIMGIDDHGVNNQYIQSLEYANCLMMETIGGFHDCQWSHPEDFNKRLVQFIDKLQ